LDRRRLYAMVSLPDYDRLVHFREDELGDLLSDAYHNLQRQRMRQTPSFWRRPITLERWLLWFTAFAWAFGGIVGWTISQL
jgi:hypothetical protein